MLNEAEVPAPNQVPPQTDALRQVLLGVRHLGALTHHAACQIGQRNLFNATYQQYAECRRTERGFEDPVQSHRVSQTYAANRKNDFSGLGKNKEGMR